MSDNIFKGALEQLSQLASQNIKLEDLMPKDIYSSVQMMIASLGQQAWIYLGKQADPITGTTKQDKDQAKIAIDCVVALSEIIKPHINEQQKLELETLKQNLQLNYLQ